MRLLPLLSLAALAASCTTADNPLLEEGEEARWELVFEDQFRGNAGDFPDPTVWTAEIGTGSDGWGNNELQYYTDRPENVQLNGEGFLVITARREEFEGSSWTSARILTRAQLDEDGEREGGAEFMYGRVEASIKLPANAPGLWPAFWMLGNDIDDSGPDEDGRPGSVVWPNCGEIDIMENFGRSGTTAAGTIHGPFYAGGAAVGEEYGFPEGEDITGFHTYRIDWDPEHIVFYVDNNVYFTVSPGQVPSGAPWVMDHPFFMLLNLAVGGNPVEAPDSTTPDVNEMVVDWVRVYERTTPIEDPGFTNP